MYIKIRFALRHSEEKERHVLGGINIMQFSENLIFGESKQKTCIWLPSFKVEVWKRGRRGG
jgi:hypothetical protein